MAKVNPSGSAVLYATYLGGSGSDQGIAIGVDGEGNAYVAGQSWSSDFPVTPGAFQADSSQAPWFPGTGSGNFLAKLNADGSALAYSTYLGGASALSVDAAGNAYVTGAAARGFPVTPGARQRCWAGGNVDLFVAEFDPGGRLAAATYLGGPGVESPGGIAAAGGDMLIVAGQTTSQDFSGAQAGVYGSAQAFAAKIEIASPDRTDAPCMAMALQNSASFYEGAIAPGELVTLWGFEFGPDSGAGMQLDSDGHISNSLAGARVFFDGMPAPLLYAQSRQINVQAPFELAGKDTTQVHVEYDGVPSNTASIAIASAAPAIFHLTYTSPQGAIINQDGTINSASNPAAVGSVISIYGTGGGVTDPLDVTGGFAPIRPLEFLTQAVTVRIGGINADVQYTGAAPTVTSGVFQVNVRVPQMPPGPASVEMSIGGVPTPNSLVTVAIR